MYRPREPRPELVERIDNAIPSFFLNPYPIMVALESGRSVTLVRADVMLRLLCGTALETTIAILAISGPAAYTEIMPRIIQVTCPYCGRVSAIEGRIRIKQAVLEFISRRVDCQATSRLLATVADYQRHAASVETGVA